MMTKFAWATRMRVSAAVSMTVLLCACVGHAQDVPGDPAILRGHLAPVLMGTFTPDGERAITVSSDETVRIWDLKTGEELRRYRGHSGPLYCLALSRNGRTLVTGAQDNTLRIWDVPQSRASFNLLGHAVSTNAVSSSPDGRMLVSVAEDGSVILWNSGQIQTTLARNPGVVTPSVFDVRAGKPEAGLSDHFQKRSGHESSVEAVAFSPDGKLFVTGDADGWIRIWSPFLQESQALLGQHVGGVVGLGFSTNSQQVFSAGAEGTIRVWQLPVTPQVKLPPLATEVVNLVVPVNQAAAVVSAPDGSLRLIDLNTGQPIREFPAGKQRPLAMALQANNGLLATSGADGRVRLIGFADAAEHPVLAGHAGPVTGLRFHPDNARLATAGIDGTVRLWSLPGPPLAVTGHTMPVTQVRSSRSGQWFATGSQDRTVRVWTAGGQPQRQMTGHEQAITALSIRGDDAQIASGDAAGVIRLWNAGNGTAEGTIQAHEGPVRSVAFDASGQILLTAGDDGTVRRWQLPVVAPRPSAGHTQPVQALELTPDGKLLVSGSADQTVRVWNVTNGQAVRTLAGATAAVLDVAISSDGQSVAASTAAGQLLVWGLADGALKHQRTLAGLMIHAVSLLPDGRVATLDSGKMLRIWELPPAGQESPVDASAAQEIPLTDPGVTHLATAPDGNQIFASGTSGVVRSWSYAGGKVTNPAPGKTYTGPGQPITGLAISRNGQWLSANAKNRTVHLWNLAGGQSASVRSWTYAADLIAVALSEDAGHVGAASADGTISVWDRESGRLFERFSGPGPAVRCLAIAGDGTQVFAGIQDHSIQTFSPANRQVLAGPVSGAKPEPIMAVASLPDALGVAALGSSGTQVLRWKPDGTVLPALKIPAGPARILRMSADGSLSVTATADGKLCLWKSADGKLLGTMTVPDGLSDLAFSADGSELAIVDGKPRVRRFSVAPFRLLEEIGVPEPVQHTDWTGAERNSIVAVGSGKSGAVVKPSLQRLWEMSPAEKQDPAPRPLAFSTDGGRLFAADINGAIRQIRINEGTFDKDLPGHPPGLLDLQVTANNQQLVSSGQDGMIRQWNIADGRLVREIAIEGSATALSLRSDSQRVVATTENGSLRVWDLQSGQPLETLPAHTAASVGVGWLNDGQTFVSGGRDRLVIRSRPSIVRSLLIDPSGLQKTIFASNGTQGLSLTSEGKLILSDLNSGQPVREFEIPEGKVLSMAIRADNQRIAVGMSTGQILVWNSGNGQLLQTITQSHPVSGLNFSPDNQKLAVVDDQKTLRIYGPVIPPDQAQAGTEWYLHQEVTAEQSLNQVVFTSDNRNLWIPQSDGTIGQWGYASPIQVRQFNHGGPVYGVAVGASGQTVVSCSTDQTVRIWDSTTGQQKFQLNGHSGPVHAVALSPDESLIVSSGSDRTLRLWDTVGGRQLKQLATLEETMYSVALHPQGQLVAAAGADRTLHLFDLLTGQEQRTLTGHSDYIHSVSFNPSGSRVLSYGYKGELKIWNSVNGQKIFDQQVGSIGNDARYSADGTRVLLSNGDATARVLDLPPAVR